MQPQSTVYHHFNIEDTTHYIGFNKNMIYQQQVHQAWIQNQFQDIINVPFVQVLNGSQAIAPPQGSTSKSLTKQTKTGFT